MIYSPLSSFVRSTDMALAAGAVISENGQALVATLIGGKPGVAPSAGTANEKFVGFANLQTSAAPVVPASAVRVEELVVPASGVLALAKTPLSGSVGVAVVETNAALAVASVTGNNVDVDAANANKLVRVTYRHSLTVNEARAKVGDVQPGGYVGNVVGQVGVGQQGVIFTSVFDTSVDWAAASAIKLGANGVLVASGSGSTLDAVVVQLPSVDYPFLGLRFDSAV